MSRKNNRSTQARKRMVQEAELQREELKALESELRAEWARRPEAKNGSARLGFERGRTERPAA